MSLAQVVVGWRPRAQGAAGDAPEFLSILQALGLVQTAGERRRLM
jgi:hypothetical protein